MTEPICDFCGASDKHRCRTEEEANKCKLNEVRLGHLPRTEQLPGPLSASKICSGITAKWERRFFDLAELVASWSKDPSSKVGAVIVKEDRSVISLGYNGFPRGCCDDRELYSDRSVKYPRVVHAELNAILSATKPVRGHTIFTTHFPCSGCAGAIIQAGIARVYTLRKEDYETRMEEDISHSIVMLNEANVRICLRHK